MALPSNSLLRRTGILKPLIQGAVQEAIEAAMAEALGAARRGWAIAPATIPARLSPGVKVPQDRQGRFSTELQRCQRSEKALVAALAFGHQS